MWYRHFPSTLRKKKDDSTNYKWNHYMVTTELYVVISPYCMAQHKFSLLKGLAAISLLLKKHHLWEIVSFGLLNPSSVSRDFLYKKTADSAKHKHLVIKKYLKNALSVLLLVSTQILKWISELYVFPSFTFLVKNNIFWTEDITLIFAGYEDIVIVVPRTHWRDSSCW